MVWAWEEELGGMALSRLFLPPVLSPFICRMRKTSSSPGTVETHPVAELCRVQRELTRPCLGHLARILLLRMKGLTFP